MNYAMIVYNSRNSMETYREMDSIGAARIEAQRVVNERMDAFGDDIDALKRFDYIAAEDQAMDIPDDGGVIFLPDGWKIEVISK